MHKNIAALVTAISHGPLAFSGCVSSEIGKTGTGPASLCGIYSNNSCEIFYKYLAQGHCCAIMKSSPMSRMGLF